jgi:hypothetical protein
MGTHLKGTPLSPYKERSMVGSDTITFNTGMSACINGGEFEKVGLKTRVPREAQSRPHHKHV